MPFMGGRQPLQARQLAPSLFTVPDPSGNAQVMRVVEVAPIMPQLPGKLNPALLDNPPAAFVGKPTGLPQAVQLAWQPGAPLPQLNTKLVLPYTADTILKAPRVPQSVAAAWQPPDPSPQQKGTFNPAILPAAAVDNPPYNGTLKIVVLPADPLPQVNAKLPQTFVPADNPPAGYRRPPIWTWDGGWTPVTAAAGAPDSVDNPPFSSRRLPHWPQWVFPDPLPTLSGKLNPTVLAVPVNEPSSFNVPKLVIQPPGPLPTLPPKVAAILATPAQVDNPPPYVRHAEILAAWIPPDPWPTQPRPFVIQGVPVDNPPFSARRVPDWLHWQPLPPLPTLAGKLPPSILAVPVDNPPFQHIGRWPQFPSLVLSWQPPDPPPVQRGPLNPSFLAVPVNNPPFTSAGRTPTFMSISAAWTIPPPPQPQQTTFINPNTPSPPPPPVTTGEFTVSGRDVVALFPVYDVAYTYNPVSKRTN
jgi:hypothetical protein